MKVFLISTPIGEETLGDLFKKLYDEVEKLGFKHVSDYISLSSKDFHTKMEQGKEAYIGFYNEMVESIQSADICIFESSTPSFGIGYLIQKALSNQKPTIVLFHKEIKSYLLSGLDDEKLIVKTYTEKNYKKVLKECLEWAKERRDKRFNFFISPKLLDYLEQVSKKNGITKSKFIRDLIVDHMRRNSAGGSLPEEVVI
jgi:hypothetical protein